MNGTESHSQSAKELRFVTSVEQMVPYLTKICDQYVYEDDNNGFDHQINAETDNFNDKSQVTLEILATEMAEPDALPNIYEEYVNFIDLSVLNPVVDAADCQRDMLIESELCERVLIEFCYIYILL